MIFQIQDPSNPIIVAAVHDGHNIREELIEYLLLKDNSRLREEDPFTGKWLPISQNTITTATSRFEVDLNRPKEKAVYLKPEDSWGLKVWKEQIPDDIYQRSLKKYSEFYSQLEKEITNHLIHNKIIVVYDLHSYNYRRNGASQPPESDALNPEINLGTGTLNRERWAPIIDRFIDETKKYNFMGRSLDIRENIKFRGGYFPRWIHENFPNNVCSLSIEFRKFFMDEWTGEPYLEVINEIKNLLQYTTLGVLEEINKMNSK
ncbi:MAG: N-formylglutamate amidohydrolase [Melioribacteraceae bacterium]|nr:N-formylglutamate amidohydrolase [Melioribacteraceae bacterium]